jgi:TAG lipase / steryl ester hydrolase / phospholipase A2 / LPA acyltransferase
MRSRAVVKTNKLLDKATTYSTWRTHAVELDAMEGLDIWKTDSVSPFYEHGLIQERLINLRAARRAGDWSQVIFSLREGLQRNLGNLANAELYRHTHVGTKYLIDDYTSEVVSLLNYICDHDIPGLPYNQKMLFFRHTGQSYGRSALMLSGGANFGMFHMGVIKALREHKLLPRVISGSSAGAVMASLLGTRNESELDALFRGEGLDLHSWRKLPLREMFRQKSIMDNSQLEKFLRLNIGEMTFEEAFKKTRRMINITVSPVAANLQPHLLNYLTTPHLLIWSAVLASCAVPGLFPPVMLVSKDQMGKERPYMASVRWVDGAIQSDLPTQRLAELYNVNHRIVSQTNPHVLPFMSDPSRKEGWIKFINDLVKGEVQYRSKQILRLLSYGMNQGITKALLEGVVAMVDQQYLGDVTIHPPVRGRDYGKVLSNLSRAEFNRWVLAGERATWPKIAMIRDQTTIGQTLEDCIIRLKKQRGRGTTDAPPGSTVTGATGRKRAA